MTAGAAAHTVQRGGGVFIVTGEPSGDFLGAQLASALSRLQPGVALRGVGSRRMQAAGVEIYLDSTHWSVLGAGAALRKYPVLRRAFKAILWELCRRPPEVLVLIDYGYFNSRIAYVAHRLGMCIVYYFQPRSWARRPGTAAAIADFVDSIAAPFPWSVEALAGRRAQVHWVGHPLLDVVPRVAPPRFSPQKPLIALVPGSRPQEIRHILPVIARAARMISQAIPGARFQVAATPALPRHSILAPLRREGVAAVPLEGVDYEAVGRANAAIAASGTATLELALLGVPMVVLYRVGGLNWLQYAMSQALGRRIRFLAMPNILADREIVPELRQARATPRAIARHALRLVTDPDRARRMRADLGCAARVLGHPGAAEAAAGVVLSLLHRRGAPAAQRAPTPSGAG